MTQLWQYRIPPDERREGWAIIVVGSDGFFGAVSDYGNYAHLWSHHGMDDFRKFLLKSDWDYFRATLNPEQVIDKTRTEARLQAMVCRARRQRQIDEWEAREAWRRAYVHNEAELSDWFNNYPGELPDEYWDAVKYMPEPQVVAFVQKVMPRLAVLIRAQLEAESLIAADRAMVSST